MSPLELAREFDAAHLRHQDEHDRDMTLAWAVVQIYVRTTNDKRMPELASLLSDSGKKAARRHRQSDAELDAMMRLMSARTGIPLTGES